MSTATQRKAWNEAMAASGAPPIASSAYSSHRGAVGGVGSRAADRRRTKRRDKARKRSDGGGGVGDGGGGGPSSREESEYRSALHMDMLEGIVDRGDGGGNDGDDDEYDEFAELDDDSDDDDGGSDDEGKGRGKGKKKRKRKGAAGGGGGGKKKKKSATPGAAGAAPKYLKARSLASILVEEAGRTDSVAREYVGAAVRRLNSGRGAIVERGSVGGDGATTTAAADTAATTTTTTTRHPRPPRRFCPVTGLPGSYAEPRTGIPYATLQALEQIRERPPPWMSLGVGSGGNASYYEAVRSLRGDDDEDGA